MSLKEAISVKHKEAENTAFNKKLINGEIDAYQYVNYLYEMLAVFSTLEERMAEEIPGDMKRSLKIRVDISEIVAVEDLDFTKLNAKTLDSTPSEYVVGSDSDPMRKIMAWKRKVCHSSGYPILQRFTKEEFIDKCKTDPEFSQEWGLKIEEQMLTEERRYNIWFNNNYETGMERFFNPEQLPDYDNSYYTPTPTKEITISYNGEKISFYE